MRLAESVVAIAGLGLMGGSLGKALVKTGACREVRALVRRQESMEDVLAAAAAHRVDTRPEKILETADLLILATPVLTIQEQVRELGQFLPDGAVLTDLGSVKRNVVDAMQTLPPGISPVGGHPMCGKEISGIKAADADLFRDRVWVITPLDRTPPSATNLVREIIDAVGARGVMMPADTHDAIVACISHLPYMLATTLVSVADEVSTELPGVWTLASSGFRDTSRVAASDVTMMMNILAANNDQVRAMLTRAGDCIRELIELLDLEDLDAVRRKMIRARTRWLGWFQSAEGKGGYG